MAIDVPFIDLKVNFFFMKIYLLVMFRLLIFWCLQSTHFIIPLEFRVETASDFGPIKFY